MPGFKKSAPGQIDLCGPGEESGIYVIEPADQAQDQALYHVLSECGRGLPKTPNRMR